MLRRHFEPYGELEYVRVIPGKNCGFVRYCFRASAEFAKAAMNDGYLDQGNEVIEVKWAHEDPNPLARQHEQRQRQLEFINAVQSKIQAIPADQLEKKRSILTLQALQRGQYPDTDAAFDAKQPAQIGGIGPTMPPTKRAATEANAVAATSSSSASTALVAAAATTDDNSGAVATTGGSSADADAAAAWAAMTPEQQQATWLAYYAAQGGHGRIDQTAVTAAAAAATQVEGDADDSRPVQLTEAYYNSVSGGFYQPNPLTNEAHPYAYGRYRRTDQQQADFERVRVENEQRRVNRQNDGGGQGQAAGAKRNANGQERRR
jgi:hypothetical protein